MIGTAWHGIYIYMNEYSWYTRIHICVCVCICMHDILPALPNAQAPTRGPSPSEPGLSPKLRHGWVVVAACVLACVGMNVSAYVV